MKREIVFKEICEQASQALQGRPLTTKERTHYDSFEQCVSSMSTLVCLSIMLFGASSPEANYIREHQNSLFGSNFIGPLNKIQKELT